MGFSKEEEIRVITRQAVHETLISLGVDPNDPQQMQADFAYIRTMRKGSEWMRVRIKTTTLTVLIPSFLYILWEAVKQAVRG